MKKEDFEKRLEELQKGVNNNLANLNLLEGCKQECLHWLEKFLQFEKELEALKDKCEEPKHEELENVA